MTYKQKIYWDVEFFIYANFCKLLKVLSEKYPDEEIQDLIAVIEDVARDWKFEPRMPKTIGSKPKKRGVDQTKNRK